MKFNDVQEVKKWFRDIPCAKQQVKQKAKFYSELASELNLSCGKYRLSGIDVDTDYYNEKVEEENIKLKQLTDDIDRLLSLLEPDEQLVLTARYLKRVRWDMIESATFYSRRHAIRIHDRALLKLVGQEVGVTSKTLAARPTKSVVLGKLKELLECDNERVVLSASKELLSLLDNEEKINNQPDDESELDNRLEVTLKVI